MLYFTAASKSFFVALLAFAVFFSAQKSVAQTPYASPYSLSWKLDAPMAGVSIGLHTSYLLLKRKLQPLTEAQILALRREDVWAFDRSPTYNWSRPAAHVSDGLMFFAMASPALLLLDGNIRRDAGKISVMGLQVFALNTGITNLTKILVQRTRPFVYNPDAPMDYKTRADARLAFFSGHTSVASSMSFFTAKVFHDYNPNSRARPYIWASAALVPAVTGYLRWRAGKHFITDILVGYAVGAVVGILVPELHRRIR
jgi:membrane-associated phospholipid phosphatase